MDDFTRRLAPDGLWEITEPLIAASPKRAGRWHSQWASLDAIQALAGKDRTTAVVEPEAQAMLTDFDRVVNHREVLVDARS